MFVILSVMVKANDRFEWYNLDIIKNVLSTTLLIGEFTMQHG